MRCLRVLTQAKTLTADRAAAERELNVAVCSANAAQQSAKLAQKVTLCYAWFHRQHGALTSL